MVSIAATSDLLASHREIHASFDQFMFTHMDKILIETTQNVLVRHRASMLSSFVLDSLYQSFADVTERNNGLDTLLYGLID